MCPHAVNKLEKQSLVEKPTHHARVGIPEPCPHFTLSQKYQFCGQALIYTDKGERKDAGSVGDPKELLKAVRDRDWNDYRVIVRDNLILLRINDVVMSEVRDHDPRRALAGLLALQVHTGPPMKVQFKNVRLRQFNR